MADNWFEQNKPLEPGDWFVANAPRNSPGTPKLTTEDSEAVGRFGLNLLPAAGAMTLGAMGPPGWAAGIGAAMLGGAGGSLAKQGIQKAVGSAEAPKTLDEVYSNTGKDALTQAGAEVGGRVINAALGRMFGRFFNPEQLYQSALKPTPSMGAEETKKIVKAALEEGVPVNRENWTTNWQKLNDQVDAAISGGPQQRPIDPQQVAQRLDALKQKWGASGDPAYGQAIDEVKQNFLTKYAAPLTPAEAQIAKKGIYKEIRNAQLNHFTAPTSPIGLTAKEELAQGLRMELEQRYPEIAELNRREGALIGLEKSLDRFVAREGNKQISPYFIFPIVGGALGAAHGMEGAGAGGAMGALGAHLVRSALEDPEVKSRLAIALFKAGNTAAAKAVAKVAPYVPGATIRIAAADLLNPQPMPPK